MSSEESSSVCIVTAGTMPAWREEIKYYVKKTVNPLPVVTVS